MSNDTIMEFDNITLRDVITLREFIDKHWQNEFHDNILDLKPLVDIYSKLVDIEYAFDGKQDEIVDISYDAERYEAFKDWCSTTQ